MSLHSRLSVIDTIWISIYLFEKTHKKALRTCLSWLKANDNLILQGNCIWEVLQAEIYRKSKVCVLTGWFLMVNGEPSVQCKVIYL